MKSVLGCLFISIISGVFLTGIIFLATFMIFGIDLTGWKAVVLMASIALVTFIYLQRQPDQAR